MFKVPELSFNKAVLQKQAPLQELQYLNQGPSVIDLVPHLTQS